MNGGFTVIEGLDQVLNYQYIISMRQYYKVVRRNIRRSVSMYFISQMIKLIGIL